MHWGGGTVSIWSTSSDNKCRVPYQGKLKKNISFHCGVSIFSLLVSGVKLGSEFGKLQKLKTLDFSKGFSCEEIPQNMFKALSNTSLEDLNMSELNITDIAEDVFSYLHFLKTLRIGNNPDLNKGGKLVKIIDAMEKDSIEHMYLINTGINEYLTDIIRGLNGTGLKTLVVDFNFIHDFEPIVSKSLTKLEILSLAYNFIYLQTDMNLDLVKMPNIRGFNISWQHSNGFAMSTWHSLARKPSEICLPHTICPLVFPRKLEWIDMSHFGIDLINLFENSVFMTNTSLKFWSLAYSGLQSFKFPVYCAWFNTPRQIVPQLETIDLSGNAIGCINSSFFQYCDWSSLNFLSVKGNKLRQSMQKECNNESVYFLDFLKPLWNLTKLDLSDNVIYAALRADSFSKQNNMQELYLSGMGLTDWSINISHMHELRFLDISKNELAEMPKSFISDVRAIESIQKQTYNQVLLQVDISDNKFECTCQSLDFLDFLKSTNITLIKFEAYICTTPNNEHVHLKYVDKIREELLVSCNPLTWLRIALLLEAVHFILVTIISLMRRYRYHIRFYYLGIQAWINKGRGIKREYLFDAFISYCETDKNWVMKRLVPNLEKRQKAKLCVAYRNWIAGRLIMENIRNSLMASRKVVFVISRNFLKSDWCLEEFSMALNVSQIVSDKKIL